MDYKEKYEMALEGIQEILGSGEDSIKMSRLQLRLQGIFPELKPKEFENKDMIRYIGNAITCEESAKYLEGKGIDMIKAHCWLESLKPQPKQEWSEEDEGFRNLLIAIMKVEHPGGVFEAYSITPFYGTVSVNRVIDWLKSLRPQNTWKPSDEQLKSLKEVIDQGHFTSYPNALETLYEQIKQL